MCPVDGGTDMVGAPSGPYVAQEDPTQDNFALSNTLTCMSGL